MSDDIEWLITEPVLHEPVLVVMLTGWIDAAGAAAAALDALSDECETSPIVRFDDDTYIDYRARRPTMELRDGVNTNLVWSTIEMRAGSAPGGRDVVLLTGPEPDAAWRRFTRTVTSIATQLGVTQMISLGAYPFAAPHTRPSRLSASSPSTDVLGTVPFARSSIDVPAGMAAALEHAMHAAKIPALGIWAQVPHYVSAMSYPAASVALLEGLEQATRIGVEAEGLRSAMAIQRERIDQMVAANDEHAAMLGKLEELYDEAIEDEAVDPALEMRSGDELAAEIQRFLRDQG
ncbi:MAG: PAC2 family protein [Ilumatobacteraceae bacterium]